MGIMGDDVIIQSIVFGDRGLEFTYAEPRDQTEHVHLLRTIAVDSELIAEEVQELVDTARQAIDAGLLAIRNPDGVRVRRPD